MKLIPLKQFVCDTCGKVINRPEDAWIEWLCQAHPKTGTHLSHKFRIVHHYPASPITYIHGCYKYTNNPDKADNHLTDFLDMYLLGLDVWKMKEFKFLMQRLTVPYFEEARFYFDYAIDDPEFDAGMFPEGGNEAGFKYIVDRYRKRYKT